MELTPVFQDRIDNNLSTDNSVEWSVKPIKSLHSQQPDNWINQEQGKELVKGGNFRNFIITLPPRPKPITDIFRIAEGKTSTYHDRDEKNIPSERLERSFSYNAEVEKVKTGKTEKLSMLVFHKFEDGYNPAETPTGTSM